MLKKVISGGQVGADIAALRAAKAAGLETGGWMPRKFRAKDGFHPEYEKLYGMGQTKSGNYPVRTRQNALDSDATVRFAYNFDSPGEICTLNAVVAAKKPLVDVDLKDLGRIKPITFVGWLRNNRIEILNVAGNADVSIERWVEEFLTRTFQMLKLKSS